jgi:predicted NAD/FAD-binding protein
LSGRDIQLYFKVLAMTNERAIRYRRLALAEPDPEKARVLQSIAYEAERGVLVTAEWMTPR